MRGLSQHNQATQNNIAMVPRSDVPRSTFNTHHTVKTTFGAGTLVPFHVDEVLPGDTHQGTVNIFGRLANLVFPIMDVVYLETFFFFVPARLVWSNFVKMMGERKSPADSISYNVPTHSISPAGNTAGTLYDYFGIPGLNQITASVAVNAMPFRAYNLIWNEWFRDENLQTPVTQQTDDGPDLGTYSLLRRNKRKDYFTGALPWPLKGGVDVTIPLAGQAPITGLAINSATAPTAGAPPASINTAGTNSTSWPGYWPGNQVNTLYIRSLNTSTGTNPQIFADLSTATGATINALRLAFQTQRLLERDARSGTRYTELVVAHFGVRNQDMRLQRPEYIGGGRTDIQTQAIPYTSVDRNQTTQAQYNPVGSLGAAATAAGRHHFSYNATEHGYIIGLINLTAEITYQQGIHRLWTRQTRYDFYWPVFANLGEQIIRNDELYATGTATDTTAFGYQERWAEYRQMPSRISGLFRSTATGTLDSWHLSQKFAALPVLNTSFIQDSTDTIMQRVLAAGSQADKMQIIVDSAWQLKRTRPMPVNSVPGNIDRF